MAADSSHLTDLYESDPGLMKNYCTGCIGTDHHCYPEIDSGVENGVSANMGNIPEEDMSIASSTDDTVAAAAVFRHLDNLIRQRIDGEIEQLKSNVHGILTDQQQEFARAFGLQDDYSSSEASASHVVPQSNYHDDANSDDCQLLIEENSDCDATMIRQYDYEESLCSNCKGELRRPTTDRQGEENEDEEKIVMNYLLRLMTASSALANTLKRKEYRT